jgi:hypothetical protein
MAELFRSWPRARRGTVRWRSHSLLSEVLPTADCHRTRRCRSFCRVFRRVHPMRIWRACPATFPPRPFQDSPTVQRRPEEILAKAISVRRRAGRRPRVLLREYREMVERNPILVRSTSRRRKNRSWWEIESSRGQRNRCPRLFWKDSSSCG